MYMPDVNCREKKLTIEESVCVQYERACGIKLGEEGTPAQKKAVGKLMNQALALFIQNVVLSAEDHREIAAAIERRARKQGRVYNKRKAKYVKA